MQRNSIFHYVHRWKVQANGEYGLEICLLDVVIVYNFLWCQKKYIDLFVGVSSLDSSNMSLRSLFVFNSILSHETFSFFSNCLWIVNVYYM
jgi:hypothetical protein